MDAISNIFSNIGGWLGQGAGGSAPGWQQLLTGGMFGAGEVGNIIEEQKRAAYQNMLMNLLKNPQQLAAMAQKISQPLTAGLTQSVGNQVQGQLAERGLGQSPGIYGATLAQSLAPYQQQNYNTALNSVLQTLGMPAGTFQQPQNLSGALQQFLQTTRPQQNPTMDPGITMGPGGVQSFPQPQDWPMPSTGGQWS